MIDYMLYEETINIASGCLWGVQEYLKHIPSGAGRANGINKTLSPIIDIYKLSCNMSLTH